MKLFYGWKKKTEFKIKSGKTQNGARVFQLLDENIENHIQSAILIPPDRNYRIVVLLQFSVREILV